MKLLVLASLAAAVLASPTRAAEPELSTDTKRMLSYGSLAVMTGICKPTLAPGQADQIQAGLQAAAEAQHDLTPAQFTEAMKAVGARVGEDKEKVCAALTPEFIATSLKSAVDGE